MDNHNLYQGTKAVSLGNLSFSGSIHPGHFHLPRFAPATTITPIDFTLRGDNTFKLFSPRRAYSDLSSRDKPSTNPSTQRSTLSSAHEFKLRRHIFTGGTVSPLTTLSFKQLRGQSSSEANGTKRTNSSNQIGTDQLKKKKRNKCLQLMSNRFFLVILGSALIFVTLSVVGLGLGLGIYFGVIIKTQEPFTNASSRHMTRPTYISTDQSGTTYLTTQVVDSGIDVNQTAMSIDPSSSTTTNQPTTSIGHHLQAKNQTVAMAVDISSHESSSPPGVIASSMS